MSLERKRILVLAPLEHRGPSGGGCVTAWMLQALCDRHDVTVATWDSFDPDDANAFYGTSLERDAFRMERASPLLRAMCAMAPRPLRLRHLQRTLFLASVKRRAASARFDTVVGVINEFDAGVPAIQYVHFPHQEDFLTELRSTNVRLGRLTRLYYRICDAIHRADRRAIARNVTLVNSNYTGRHYREIYHTDSMTVYPPVRGDWPFVPTEQRENGFVCLGRIEPSKEIEKVIQIIEAVRARGHDVTLRIIGGVESQSYYESIARMAHDRSDWLRIHPNPPRQELCEITARMRYGIHGKCNEDFGIGPAELQRAGCITFVPDSGGVAEVVGNDPGVMYRSAADAVDKISGLLDDDAKAAAAQRDAVARGEAFSAERFMKSVQDVVAAMHDL